MKKRKYLFGALFLAAPLLASQVDIAMDLSHHWHTMKLDAKVDSSYDNLNPDDNLRVPLNFKQVGHTLEKPLDYFYQNKFHEARATINAHLKNENGYFFKISAGYGTLLSAHQKQEFNNIQFKTARDVGIGADNMGATTFSIHDAASDPAKKAILDLLYTNKSKNQKAKGHHYVTDLSFGLEHRLSEESKIQIGAGLRYSLLKAKERDWELPDELQILLSGGTIDPSEKSISDKAPFQRYNRYSPNLFFNYSKALFHNTSLLLGVGYSYEFLKQKQSGLLKLHDFNLAGNARSHTFDYKIGLIWKMTNQLNLDLFYKGSFASFTYDRKATFISTRLNRLDDPDTGTFKTNKTSNRAFDRPTLHWQTHSIGITLSYLF